MYPFEQRRYDEMSRAEAEGCAVIPVPITRAGIGEMQMHYDECLMWVEALEWFIRNNGLDVPTWQDIYRSGWKPSGKSSLT